MISQDYILYPAKYSRDVLESSICEALKLNEYAYAISLCSASFNFFSPSSYKRILKIAKSINLCNDVCIKLLKIASQKNDGILKDMYLDSLIASDNPEDWSIAHTYALSRLVENNPWVNLRLAKMYAYGKGVAINIDQSLLYLNLPLKKGITQAYDLLIQLEKKYPNYFLNNQFDLSLIHDVFDVLHEITILNRKVSKLEDTLSNNFRLNEKKFWETYQKPGEIESDYKIDFFSNIEPKSDTLRILQKSGLLLFKELDKYCNELNIEYWMSFGTLLGAIRHKGFIPWDDDIDIGMTCESFNVLVESIKNNPIIEGHWYVEKTPWFISCIYKVTFKSERVPFIDVFPYDYVDDIDVASIELYRKLRSAIYQDNFKDINAGNHCDLKSVISVYENAVRSNLNKHGKNQFLLWGLELNPSSELVLDPLDIFPLISVQFEDAFFSAPHNYEKYLRGQFGNYYEMPIVEMLHAHVFPTELELHVMKKRLGE